jgi:hypothetical protein
MLGPRVVGCGVEHKTCALDRNRKPTARSSSSHPSQYNKTALCMQSNMSSASQAHGNELGLFISKQTASWKSLLSTVSARPPVTDRGVTNNVELALLTFNCLSSDAPLLWNRQQKGISINHQVEDFADDLVPLLHPHTSDLTLPTMQRLTTNSHHP